MSGGAPLGGRVGPVGPADGILIDVNELVRTQQKMTEVAEREL